MATYAMTIDERSTQGKALLTYLGTLNIKPLNRRWRHGSNQMALKKLFDYYRYHASEIVALGLRDTIMDDVEKLEEFPTMGIRDDECKQFGIAV